MFSVYLYHKAKKLKKSSIAALKPRHASILIYFNALEHSTALTSITPEFGF